MSVPARDRIVAILRALEVKHGIRILFAAEAGSRAHGMASPDSDFDVRGIYVPCEVGHVNMARALRQVKALPMDLTFFAEGGLIDVALWDIRKAAALLGEGKTAVLEWARSPIVYLSRGTWPAPLARFITHDMDAHTAALRHYAGLLRSGIHQNLRDERVDGAFATATSVAANAVIGAVSQLRRAVAHGHGAEVGAFTTEAHGLVDALAGLCLAPRPMAPKAETEAEAGIATSTSTSTSTSAGAGTATATFITAKKLSYVLQPAVYVAWLLQHKQGLPPLDVEAVLADIAVRPDIRAEMQGILVAKRNAATKNAWCARPPLFEAWVTELGEIVTWPGGKVALCIDGAALLSLVQEAEAEAEATATTTDI